MIGDEFDVPVNPGRLFLEKVGDIYPIYVNKLYGMLPNSQNILDF